VSFFDGQLVAIYINLKVNEDGRDLLARLEPLVGQCDKNVYSEELKSCVWRLPGRTLTERSDHGSATIRYSDFREQRIRADDLDRYRKSVNP
jgi:hypothetical protein